MGQESPQQLTPRPVAPAGSSGKSPNVSRPYEWNFPKLPAGAAERGIEVQNRPRFGRESKIEAALKESTSCDFRDFPLNEAVSILSSRHKIPIRLDEESLQKMGVNRDALITCKVNEVRLASALSLLLQDLGGQRLTTIHDEIGLKVLTEEDAERHREIRIYDVKPLQFANLQSLINILLEIVPGPWQETDGEGGVITPFDGTLVISQTQHVHKEIHELLETMLRHLATPDPTNRTPQILVHQFPRSAQERSIEQLLQQPVDVDFQNLSLQKAIATFREVRHLPIHFDDASLQESGVSKETRLTLNTQGKVPIHVALSSLLENIGGAELRTVIKEDLLLVTTAEAAEKLRETRIYVVRSLQVKDPLTLIDVIQETGTGLWQETDGEGGAINAWAGSLLIRQSRKAHEQVQALLEQLLEMRNRR